MTDSPHVIIVGAGFAGLSAVGKLRKAGFRVTVIDKNLYSTFQPLLYQVATGGLNPGDVSYAVGGFTSAAPHSLRPRRPGRHRRGRAAGEAHRRAGARLRLPDAGHRRGGELLRPARGGREHLRALQPRRRHRAPRPHHERLRAAERERRPGPGVRDHRGRRRRDRGRARGHRGRAPTRGDPVHVPRRGPGPGPRPAHRDGTGNWSCRSTRSCGSTPGGSWSSGAWTSG